jgi:molybdopterin converting factor small subunit
VSTKVNLYSNLRSYADDKGTVEVNGATVGDCLSDLIRQFPKLRSKLFDASGKLSSQIFVSINMNSTNPEKTGAPVKEGDELYIVLIVAGG